MTYKINTKKRTVAVLGLGITGKSALNFLRKKKVKKIFTYDDKLKVTSDHNKKNFANYLNFVDFIIYLKFHNLIFHNSKFVVFLVCY